MKKVFVLVSMALSLVGWSGDYSSTLDFAKNEAVRLMGKANVDCTVSVSDSPYSLTIIVDGKKESPVKPSISSVNHDGYAISVAHSGYVVSSRTEKGVLNGLYSLAEKLGFAFVMPGEKGEVIPAKLENLEVGQWTENPRFAYRGIFSSSKWVISSCREWYHFLAKLRFNSLCAHVAGTKVPEEEFARILGFRLEVGGHGMSDCLPRARYESEPELFRMFQPEDFGGKRLKDSNFCPSNPKTRKIVKENFKKKISPAVENGYHAVHAWADDLPAGGWCMCSRCRALTATDQSQYTMNLEAQAIREMGAKLRVPAIAYHDTMFPSWTIAPDPLCFLLFAPRERCYAHALNDSSCALNTHYLKALNEWVERYKGIDNSHTFEYYNDKLLYRGHTPYLPSVLIGDADTYEKAGIEAWMSLQVGGELLAPDWNMLAHSVLAWERDHTRETITRRLASMLTDQEGDWETWYRYLDTRASAYQSAFSVCDVPSKFYFDYRFMPERPSGNGGAALIEAQRLGRDILVNAFNILEINSSSMKGTSSYIANLELKRCRFEKVDLAAMVEHQRGLVNIADYWNGAGDEALKSAIKYLEKAIVLIEEANKLCHLHNPDKKSSQYYFSFAKNWSVPEIKNKIRVYSQEFSENKGANDILLKSKDAAEEGTKCCKKK